MTTSCSRRRCYQDAGLKVHANQYPEGEQKALTVAQSQLTPVCDTVGMDIGKCLYSLSRSLPSDFARQSITRI